MISEVTFTAHQKAALQVAVTTLAELHRGVQ